MNAKNLQTSGTRIQKLDKKMRGDQQKKLIQKLINIKKPKSLTVEIDLLEVMPVYFYCLLGIYSK